MKNPILFAFITLLFFSCNVQKYSIENQLIRCYNNKNILNEIFDFEKELVSKKILNNKKGKSYIQLLKKINSEQYAEIEIPENIIKIISSTEISHCHNKIYKNSKYTKSKAYKLNIIFSDTQKRKNSNTKNVINKILKLLSAKDFEVPYYKLMAFKIILIHDNNFGIREKLPKASFTKHQSNVNSKNSLLIKFNDSEIIINGNIMNPAEFQIKAKKYLQENKSKSVFIIQTSRNTSYNVYKNTIKLIDQEIMKLRNEYSLKQYKTTFNKLSAEKKLKVKTIYPKKIIDKSID